MKKSTKSKIIIILGPTASGKSDLAVKMAKRFNGEIISADSRQVYKGLNIGSGKITKKEMRGVPHYLLDVASPKKTFTAEQYKKLAQKAIKKIIHNKKIPIICGGAGLYIDSVIYDYQFPKVPPNLKLRKQLEKLSTEELFKKLSQLDKRRSKNIDKNNSRRLIRAIEIIEKLGKVPLLTLKQTKNKNSSYEFLKIGILLEQEKLKANIKKRLYKRLKIGMIKEVENLHNLQNKQGLNWKRLDDLGLEYRYISQYLRELISKKEMEELIIKESIKYSKRQMTWFNRDKNIYWINSSKQAINITKNFL
ncbi:tRNA (adenosine(37)-N6)-dimethylallyltransferase MiaA [Candidatus Wolfebacteria bacterium CG10_big_fil_rev_8_21_14_0_10_31_9]|uniref:tRNA dimethylallyltransferase n=1 Tax=Candidatus Wolfebacteria bacterium CG10_big_fil_rev_8_21_14_0_10_31_9 TaxID=1975070 RepID=A0A2H0RCK1_9BACT|nr:MAG: tRNA (adenosine(37)-N6)-dimethylallyltransferase MiaA [Candidatus Wolfebacteria bacterium CG10_big_fil_rev_8_21_14_0_10_31_9]